MTYGPKFGVHLSHCNFGENAGVCKYGDENCPALSEDWSWFGRSLESNKRITAELHTWLKANRDIAGQTSVSAVFWQTINAIVTKHGCVDEYGYHHDIDDIKLSGALKLEVEKYRLQLELELNRPPIISYPEAHLCNGQTWRAYPSAVCSLCKDHNTSIHHENLIEAVNRLQKQVFELSK